jgi:hypothetical protein
MAQTEQTEPNFFTVPLDPSLTFPNPLSPSPRNHPKQQKINSLRLTRLPSPLRIQSRGRVIIRQNPHQMRRLLQLQFRQAVPHLGEEGRRDGRGEDGFAGGWWVVG